ncbi:MAG: hypothetical protein UU10_C0026G0002 [Parcubacteria group bacterium GW2011_GWF1_40_6]|nr:MAG: hypothetical protein UT78_C0007G0021 [Candidatus Nomurabacteria bacterium GW2011_GWF2_40_12]KKR68369.1 MAG: hypothetical protein UU10_C0026G0002 [Parcubacteria group bacterium GW2011_GWF1_40_6]OGJ14132.1 MAG: hypothetical protein A2585_02020 [Candidatus Nomurabacteria bacterium RIFOXYD1_FULL_39_12]
MQSRFLPLYLIAMLLLVGIFLPSDTLAVSSSSILVNVTPENPAPNEDVSITLNSYASNLDSVLIIWSVNGKNVLSGIGKKSFSLKAPDAGGETSVIASISLPDGTIDKRIMIRPSVMALLWQANDSYVPPFYRGKALPTMGSEIKIVAIPEIKNGAQTVNPKNIVYAWKRDYTNKQDSSGYGKSSFTYVDDYLEDSSTIGVTATTTDQKYSSAGSIVVRTTNPKILFYKRDLTLGTLWEKALANGHIIQGNEIIEAAPYFISPKEIRIPTLVFNWFINDYQIAVPSYKKNIMPLAVQSGTSGTSTVKLEIEDTYKIFGGASKELEVQF